MRGLSLLCVVGSIAVVAGTTASALAQAGSGGTITDGDCTFTQVVSPTSGTATPATGSVFRVNGAGGTDHTFYDWWWFRVNGVDTREFAFNSATSWNWAGRSGTVNYTTANFTAVLSWTITDTGTNSGQIDTSARITNTTAAPLNLALFHGFDMDYAGSIGTDGVVLTSPGLMTLTDTVAAAPFLLRLKKVLSKSARADIHEIESDLPPARPKVVPQRRKPRDQVVLLPTPECSSQYGRPRHGHPGRAGQALV